MTTDNHELNRQIAACEIVSEARITDLGPGEWYYLKIGGRVIPLGRDASYADRLAFILRRNAKAFDPSAF